MPTAKTAAATDTSAPIPQGRPSRSVARKFRRVLRTIERSPGVPQHRDDARAVDAPTWRAGLAVAVKQAPEFAPGTWAIAAKGSAWPIPAATLARPDVLAHVAALLTAHCVRNVSRAAKKRARSVLDQIASEGAR